MLFIKLKEILSRDTVQRILYGIAFAFWILLLLLLDDPHSYSHSSILNPDDLILLIPAAILLLQLIINTKWLWAVIFGLFTLQMAYAIIAFFWNLGSYPHQFSESLIYCSICLCVDAIIFYMKPQY